MSASSLVLAVDRSWTPERWLGWEDVLNLYSRGLVDYAVGATAFVLRGGTNAKTGKQSRLDVGSVLVIDTKGHSLPYTYVPHVSRKLLFRRDRNLCAYCGQEFRDVDLTIEHILPESRGGTLSWTNIVAACKQCNNRKDCRTPDEAGMSLLYVPYVPNRFEDLLVRNRNILADQMELLRARLPKHSRLI